MSRWFINSPYTKTINSTLTAFKTLQWMDLSGQYIGTPNLSSLDEVLLFLRVFKVGSIFLAIYLKLRTKRSYIGERVNLRNRASAHRNNSKDLDRAVMRVSRHVYECGRGFRICPILKLKEECKISRLVKEDNLIKLFKPDLNADKRNLLHLNLI